MWHFTNVNRILGYGDGREIIAGKKLKVTCDPVLCDKGLHASRRLIDAANYAPGPYVWSVRLSGKVVHGNDKSVATERTAVWGYDATEVLRKFSRVVALDAVTKYWNETKFGKFPEVVKQWLETGDESLRSAAWSSAWSSARSATRSSALSAAESATESAAESADWSSARTATRSAAWSAAWSAAESATRTATRSAAESAAWSAAESAAWSDYNKLLTKMILAGRPRSKKAVKK